MKARKLESAAVRWRAYVESKWPQWNQKLEFLFPGMIEIRKSVSHGMCDLTTVWLQGIIGGEIKSGFILPSQSQHTWLEHSGLIIDLTADQFGLAPVIVAEKFTGIGDKYIELPWDADMEFAIAFDQHFLRLAEPGPHYKTPSVV